MRLIDVDALVNQIRQEPTDGMYTEEILKIIAEQPIVEAIPIVHARWVGESDGYADGLPVYDVWHCGECGYTIDDGTDDPDLLPAFCPNCGSNMDGDADG